MSSTWRSIPAPAPFPKGARHSSHSGGTVAAVTPSLDTMDMCSTGQASTVSGQAFTVCCQLQLRHDAPEPSRRDTRLLGVGSRCMRFLQAIVVIALVGALRAPPANAQPVDVPKTNPMKVYMHYMPWFDTPAVLGAGNWGYHWRMNNQNPNIVDASGKRQIASHYYPKIGPYQSNDPDVIEYHLLLMKLSGVDGVMIDWYGVQGTNGDINRLLTNSNAVVDRVDDVGLNFSVVMEDRFSANINQAKANVAYLRDNYFNKPDYTRIGRSSGSALGRFRTDHVSAINSVDADSGGSG